MLNLIKPPSRKVLLFVGIAILFVGTVGGGYWLFGKQQKERINPRSEATSEACTNSFTVEKNSCQQVAVFAGQAGWQTRSWEERQQLNNYSALSKRDRLVVIVKAKEGGCTADSASIIVAENGEEKNLSVQRNPEDPLEFFADYSLPDGVDQVSFSGQVHFDCASNLGLGEVVDPQESNWWRSGCGVGFTNGPTLTPTPSPSLTCRGLKINGRNAQSQAVVVSAGQSVTVEADSDDNVVIWRGRYVDPTVCDTREARVVDAPSESIISQANKAFNFSSSTTGCYVFEANVYSADCQYACSAGGVYYQNTISNDCTAQEGWQNIGSCTSNNCIGYLKVEGEEETEATGFECKAPEYLCDKDKTGCEIRAQREGWITEPGWEDGECITSPVCPNRGRYWSYCHNIPAPPDIDNPERFMSYCEEYSSPVKVQHGGTCWAHSITGAMEANYKALMGQIINLSEGYLSFACRDCFPGINGCEGGWGYKGVSWIKENGIVDEECNSSKCPDVSSRKCSDWENHRYFIGGGGERIKVSYNEAGQVKNLDQIRNTIKTHGPVAASLLNPNHAVVVCGYDDFARTFKIKNSWGAGWREGGYGYIPYDFIAPMGLREIVTVDGVVKR